MGVNVIDAIMQETGISKTLVGATEGLFLRRRVAMTAIVLATVALMHA